MTDVSFMTVTSATSISRFLSPPELYRLGQYLREAFRDPADRDACLDWVADTDAYSLWQELDLAFDEGTRQWEHSPRDEVMELTCLTYGRYKS
jgi:hypothetical protein